MSRRRSLSLRVRVALASALAATIVIAAIGMAFVVFLRVSGSEQLDQTLNSMSLSLVSPLIPVDQDAVSDNSSSQLSIPSGESAGVDPVRSESVDGATVRSREVEVSGALGTSVAVTVPESPISRAIHEKQWQVAGVAVAAVALAAGLGWLFAGRAVRPLQRLSAATHTVGEDVPISLPDIRGVREAEDLASSIEKMLDRIGKAQKRTGDALNSARDFAAVSAHELRTPLTSMRTNLDVLATMSLTDMQGSEILDELRTTERQIEATLSGLESLAVGELSGSADFEHFDLVELADRCVQHAARRFTHTRIELSAPLSLSMWGLPSGIRMILENSVTNAVLHGRADLIRIEISVAEDLHAITLTVDDNGVGVPEGERAGLFERFARGTSAHPDGSGLGLALIAQQASIHAGSVELADSPLGGARLYLNLRTTV